MEFRKLTELLPPDFEKLIGRMLQSLGYEVKQIPQEDGVGIDLVASKERETIAVQVKKYKTRKINLAMIYHAYGAAAYYDCSRAVIATLNILTPIAAEAANKLNVEIWGQDTLLELLESSRKIDENLTAADEAYNEDWYYTIWNNHVRILEGETCSHLGRRTHITVTSVDDDGIAYENSKGNRGTLNIDVFRQVLKRLRREGCITRAAINDEYSGRASSAICAILVKIPGIVQDTNAQIITIMWINQEKQLKIDW